MTLGTGGSCLRSLAAITLLASSLVVSVGSPAGSAVTCSSSLTKVPSVRTVKDVNGVAGVSSTDVWAVGLSSRPINPIAEHWNGATWTKVLGADPGKGDAGFNDAAAIATDDVWAVGWKMASGVQGAGYQPLVERWDGSAWSVVPTPSTGTANAALVGVASVGVDDIWAVGYTANGTSRRTLVEHWDGTRWSIVSSPNGGTLSNGLLAVDALATDDVWTVGYASSGTGFSPLIEHWDGVSWNTVAAQSVGSQDNVLTGISGASPSDMWAVGYAVKGSSYQTLTEHSDGTGWQIVPSPNVGSVTSMLFDVTASPTGTWAVGSYYDAAGSQTLAEYWDGARWSVQPSPSGRSGHSLLSGVDTTPDTGDIWAAGRFGLLEHACRPWSPAGASGVDSGKSANPPAPGPVIPSHPSDSPRSSTTSSKAKDVTTTDVASTAGIAENTRTFLSGTIGDLNSDGAPDIFLSRHQNSGRLYLNDGSGTYSEIDGGTFGANDRHGCVWGDFNGDKLLDLFCAVGADSGSEVKHDELWIQQPDGSFVDEAASFGVIDPLGRGRDPVVLDANDDGWPDLFITNRHARPDGLPSPDRLFLNMGGTGFVDAPGFGMDSDSGIQSACAQAADVNADGLQDIMLCTPSKVRIYQNVAGTSFLDVTNAMDTGSKAAGAELADLNGDGSLDLVTASQTSLTVRLQNAGVFTTSFTYPLVAGFSVATGDVNGDGAPDIYVQQAASSSSPNEPDLMFLNDGDGTSFTQMPIPETSAGSADNVVSLDYDNNGLADFLVTNGLNNKDGPVQLIAFQPSHGPN